jgi:glycosyltransferase involved in cell wall biosynthesis
MIALFIPGRVWKFGENYYSQTSYPLEMRALGNCLLPVELIAFVTDAAELPRQFYLLEQFRFQVRGLSAPRNGADLLMRLPRTIYELHRIFKARASAWTVMIVYDAGLLSQAAVILCRRFRVPCFIRIAGDSMASTRARLKQQAGFLGNAARLALASEADLAMRAMGLLANGVIVTGAQLAAKFRSVRNLRQFVAVNISMRDLEPELPGQRTLCGGGSFRILTVGRVTPVKGLEFLLSATALLRDLGIPAELTIVGPFDDADYAHALEAQAHELGLSAKVHFPGRVAHGPALWEFYRRADVFVLTSLTEGTPNVVPEALAKGLPIVASRVGGIPQLVQDGYNGYLVEPGKPEQIAGALGTIAKDAELRLRMAHASIALAPAFTMENQINPMVRWVLEMVGRAE